MDFRRRLEAALVRTATPPVLTTLGWHEHLYGCDDCRDLLQAEEALEVLLDSLPDPELPRDLAERLLRRLAPACAAGLDALLELDRVETPPGLPLRTLAGLSAARADAKLDTLLDSLPDPAPPPDLARRVLRGLESERRPARGPRLVQIVGTGAPALLAAAAAVLAVVGAYAWWPAGPEQRLGGGAEDAAVALSTPVPGQPAELAPPAAERGTPDPRSSALSDNEFLGDEFLASLELLEDWELLSGLLDGEDVDLLLATLGASDELLLQSADDTNVEAEDGALPGLEPAAEPRRG